MAFKDDVLNFILEEGMLNLSLDKVIHQAVKRFSTNRVKVGNTLLQLERDGKIKLENDIVLRGQSISVAKGTYTALKKGNGKVSGIVDGKLTEIFVTAKNSLNAPNNSKVFFTFNDKHTQAQIIEVLGLSSNLVYGVVLEKNGKLIFKSNSERFGDDLELVQNEFAKLAVNKKVAVKLQTSDIIAGNTKATALIDSHEQIFGHIESPYANIQAAIAEAGVKTTFNKRALIEAENIPTEVRPDDLMGRTDFRHINFVTIDPETCKDMDDAVYVERIQNKFGQNVGYRLYVAIADVSHYVQKGSEIDVEAYSRGTSIYPAGSVIPMLPEKLSNGICSLNPHVDRLAMVTVMDINSRGEVERFDFKNGVIQSRNKFSYEEVSALHHNDKQMLEKYGDYKETVDLLYELETKIAKTKERYGALKLQGYEPTIVLDKAKENIIDYRNDNRVDSHKVIERAMVANNVVVAKFFYDLNLPTILRVHDTPGEKAFNIWYARMQELGIDVDDIPNSKTYQKALEVFSDTNLEKVLTDQTVRSLPRAKYSTDTEIGHFALAEDNYTHFTSPIRRYVDLKVHRQLKEVLKVYEKVVKQNDLNTTDKFISEHTSQLRHYGRDELSRIENVEDLNVSAHHLTMRDNEATDLSRRTDSICAAIYMQSHIGEIKKAYISNIDEKGVTATLSDPEDPLHSDIIEVIIPFTELNLKSKHHVDTNGVRIVSNENGKKAYELGDEIKVKIIESDPNTALIIASTNLEKQIVKSNDEELELSRKK